MKIFTRSLIVISIALIMTVTAFSQEVIKTANVGIGNVKPLSKFEVNGSFGEATTAISAAATLDATHATVLAAPVSAYNITLPLASSATLRVYTIVYNGTAGGNTITIQTGGSDHILADANSSTSYALTGGAITIQSDGTNWHVTHASPPVDGTAGGVFYGTGIGSAFSTSGTAGQVLQSNGLGAPTWVTPSTSGTAWQLLGNTAITNPAAPATYGTSTFGVTENWLGTTDSKDLAFGTNKIERMRIGGGTVATAGFVGIGTATPKNKLDVSGAVAIGTFAGASAAPANGLAVSGSVGIGTNTPGAVGGALLELKGPTSDATNSPDMQFVWSTGASAGFPACQWLNYLPNNEDIAFDSYFDGTTWRGSYAGPVYQVNKGGANTELNFTYATAASVGGAVTFTPGMSLNASGNVGIGTSGQLSRLSVSGGEAIGTYAATAAAPANGLAVSGSVGIGTTTPGTKGSAILELDGPQASASSPDMQFVWTNTASAGFPAGQWLNYTPGNEAITFDGYFDFPSLSWKGSFVGPTYQIYSSGNNELNFNYATAASIGGAVTYLTGMALNANGNIGIGTTGQLSKLDVLGGVAIGTYAGTAAAPANGLAVSGSVGIGTNTPNQKLEIGTTANTIRVDGLGTGGSFVLAATTTTDRILFAKATGDMEAMPSGSNGQVLTLDGTTGVPTWETPAPGGVTSVTATSPLSITGTPAVPNVLLSGTSGGVLYGTGTGSAFTTAGPINEVLEGQGPGNAPIWTTVSALAGSGDNWGSQTAVTDSSNDSGIGENTITGDGFTHPLRLAQQTASNNQVLAWNTSANTWKPASANAVLSGTAGEILYGTGTASAFTTGGTTGQVLQWNTSGVPTWVSPSSAGAWNITGNSGVTYAANFIGTITGTDQGLMFKVNGNIAGRIEDGTSANGSNYNTSLGYQALNANTAGSFNVAMGFDALNANTIQSGNIAIGDSALYTQNFSTPFNSGNVAIGNSALFADQPNSTTAGYYNTAVGEWALRHNTNGPYNTALGWSALYANTTGNWNTGTGLEALYSNTTGTQNTATGMQALYSNVSGIRNTATGVNTLWHNTGSYNTATGFNALYAGSGVSTGWYNTAEGYNTLFNNATGSSNTAVGANAGLNSTSSMNVFVGDSAGLANTSGASNTFIGYGASANAGTYSNATVIGANAIATANNSVTLGASNATALFIPGYQTVGALLYTAAPTGLIVSTTAGTSGQVLTSTGGGAPTWTTPGTVTSVSATAPLSITTPTTTPNILLSGTSGEILYGTGASSAFTTGGSTGQVLQWNLTGVPTWVSPSGGSSTVITDSNATAGVENTITGTGTLSNPLKLAQQHATSAQVLQWNGVSWVPATLSGGVGDNWGGQSVVTNTTLAGNGLVATPLGIAQQGAITGQALEWNGTSWAPATVVSSSGWNLTGNTAITNPAAPATYGTSTFGGTENWLGTTDAKDLAFGTDKIERMRIGGGTVATASFVGIGTVTPKNKLDVSGAIAIGTFAGVSTAPANGLAVSGSVGIGTNTPGVVGGALLELKGPTSDATNSPDMQFVWSTGTSAGFPACQWLNYLPNNESIAFDGYFDGTTWRGSIAGTSFQINKGGANTELNFTYATSASVGGAITYTNGMSLNASGNVGIGTTGQLSRLSVSGGEAIGTYAATAAAPANGLAVSGSVGIGTTTPGTKGSAVLELDGPQASASSPDMQFVWTNTASAGFPAGQWLNYTPGNEAITFDGYFDFPSLSWKGSFIGPTYQIYSSGNNELNFNYATAASVGGAVTYSTGMALNASGNIGIGTTGQLSRLDVAGGVAIGAYAGTAAAPANGLAVSGSVGIGTNVPAADAGVAIKGSHIEVLQGATATTIAATANAGTSATAAFVNGTDVGGGITVTTGTGSYASGAQVTITFGNAYTTAAPAVVITPTDDATAAAMSSQHIYVTSTLTMFSVNFGVAPAAPQAYNFNYFVIETK